MHFLSQQRLGYFLRALNYSPMLDVVVPTNFETLHNRPSIRPLSEVCWHKSHALKISLVHKKKSAVPLKGQVNPAIATRLKQETTRAWWWPNTYVHARTAYPCRPVRAVPANLRGTVTGCNYALWTFDCPADIPRCTHCSMLFARELKTARRSSHRVRVRTTARTRRVAKNRRWMDS